jgi:hypothetical protein
MSDFIQVGKHDAINLDLVRRVTVAHKDGGKSTLKIGYVDTVGETIVFDERRDAESAYRSILTHKRGDGASLDV